MLDHPILVTLGTVGAVSFLQAVFNGNPISVFYLTATNIFDLLNFFLMDVTSLCLGFVNYCLPDAFVTLFNLLKGLAFILMVMKDLWSFYMQYVQTVTNVAQTSR